MSIEAVRKYFSQFGMEEKILEFPTSSATVELAALAVGCEPGRIAKTLSFKTAGAPILLVTAGDMRVDNARFRSRFGCKAKMLRPEETEALVGHSVGGICPFGIRQGVAVYLDGSLKRFPTVFPACGSGNSAIELSPQELERFANAAAWVDVCRPAAGQ